MEWPESRRNYYALYGIIITGNGCWLLKVLGVDDGDGDIEIMRAKWDFKCWYDDFGVICVIRKSLTFFNQWQIFMVN